MAKWSPERAEAIRLFIDEYFMENHASPTVREIAAADARKSPITDNAPAASVAPSPVYTTVAKPAEEEKPSVDLSDVVIGTAVTHAKFGDGKIVNIDKAGKYIRVAFSVGEKTFANNAFEQGFLKLKE